MLWLRTVGALLLAGLLLAVRGRSAIWATIVATWMAGPPLIYLLGGIYALAASAGQYSVPTYSDYLYRSALIPLFVTVCLLGSKRVREHYRP